MPTLVLSQPAGVPALSFHSYWAHLVSFSIRPSPSVSHSFSQYGVSTAGQHSSSLMTDVVSSTTTYLFTAPVYSIVVMTSASRKLLLYRAVAAFFAAC